jgi:hypothetical protein
MLHKKDGEMSKKIKTLKTYRLEAPIEDRAHISPSFLPCGKAGGLQIRRCQRLAVVPTTAAPLAPWL